MLVDNLQRLWYYYRMDSQDRCECGQVAADDECQTPCGARQPVLLAQDLQISTCVDQEHKQIAYTLTEMYTGTTVSVNLRSDEQATYVLSHMLAGLPSMLADVLNDALDRAFGKTQD